VPAAPTLDTADHITATALTDRAAALVAVGTVLVVVRGMILARIFPVVTAGVPMAINQDLKAVCARGPSRNDWLAWLFRASEPETLKRLDEAGHGTKTLRMDAWGDMRIPVPPPDEQQGIAEAIAVVCARIDDLIGESTGAMALLQERRAALISAAVTGKIDVRDLAS
jgi:type I restriction enzyme S subunit